MIEWTELKWKVETPKERRNRMRVAYEDLFRHNEKIRRGSSNVERGLEKACDAGSSPAHGTTIGM